MKQMQRKITEIFCSSFFRMPSGVWVETFQSGWWWCKQHLYVNVTFVSTFPSLNSNEATLSVSTLPDFISPQCWQIIQVYRDVIFIRSPNDASIQWRRIQFSISFPLECVFQLLLCCYVDSDHSPNTLLFVRRSFNFQFISYTQFTRLWKIFHTKILFTCKSHTSRAQRYGRKV